RLVSRTMPSSSVATYVSLSNSIVGGTLANAGSVARGSSEAARCGRVALSSADGSAVAASISPVYGISVSG
ncbi:hypothetical protein, partial [Salmonella enterica]|uniref:hypothetical protein n=1 Tax=Salmonella enterica TaxID=28901 RepID=UPI00329A36F0